MNLIIVESPTKAKTISQFLGSDYEVESSYGHIRDLPKNELGVDVQKNFEPRYVIPTKARKTVNKLKKQAEMAQKVILATDEDREGEAIAWHLIQALGLNDSFQQSALNNQLKEKKLKKPKAGSRKPKAAIERIVFHEITKKAVEEALRNPREIDIRLVDSQQARRILDRLVGYELSPFLWRKIARGLSAGRVQSVTVRLIADRENEIRNFQSQEYWTIVASLSATSNQQPATSNIEANLVKINDKPLEKLAIENQEQAEKIKKELEQENFVILDTNKKTVKKNPLPPFITSTLQQEASKRLGFSAKQTMRLAQNLYENGLITYMRTDSFNLSKESVIATKAWIEKELGEKYAVQAPRFFKTKSRLAQEAHEAIRPTRLDSIPKNLGGQADLKLEGNEEQLYELIWRRFIASQLPEAQFDATQIDIKAGKYGLRANGNILKFDGFLKIWPLKFQETILPELAKDEKLDLEKVITEQHFTEPPPRFNEATLIKTLEEYGIGRPSTYAPIISVIQERNYVEKDERRRFRPTEMGELVNKVLTEHFPEIVDVGFTVKIEEDLDEIARGEIQWQPVIKEFYEPFKKNLEQKYQEVSKKELTEESSEEVCEKCGRKMIIKLGRYGKFLACSGYPECKNIKSIKETPKTIGLKCPKCQEGEVIERRTKKGRLFYGCSRWPKCDYASWQNPNKIEQ